MTPRAPAAAPVRAKTVAKSASGALEIQHFSPVSRQPSGPSGSAARDSAAASEPAPGSLSAKAATARPHGHLRQPAGPLVGGPGLHHRIGPQALECQRGLRLRALLGEGFPQQTQVQGAQRAVGGEQTSQQAQFTEGGDQRAVDPALLPLLGQRTQPFGGQRAQFGAPFLLVRSQREYGHEAAPWWRSSIAVC